MSTNHIKLIYCLLYMIHVTHDHTTVNILDVEMCRIRFLLSKASHIKSNLLDMYVSICVPHPADGNLTDSRSAFLLCWVLTELR